MATANTLPIELRRELVPVLRSGNFAGPGYAGGWGSESVITNAAINNGQPIQVAELVKTPQGLIQFMSLATKTEPNGYLDAVTRNHDVEYTVAEVRFMNKVQTQFDGKLPYELSASDKSSSAYQELLSERNQEYWTADQRMLKAAVAYQPTDYADSTYRDLMVKGFYVKASDGVGGEYKLPQTQLDEFFNTLKAQDPSLGTPSTFGQKLDTLGFASNLARSDFEALATLPITPQEKAFFNSHLQPGDSIVPSDRTVSGETILWDQRDFAHSVVVPYVSPTDSNIYVAQVKVGDKEITSYLDRTDKDNPVFTQEVRVNGALVSTETRIPVPETGIRTGENTARAYQVELRDGNGELQQSYTTEKPVVPDLIIDKDLQAKLLAVQTGNYSEVVPEIQTNPHNADAVNGMDLQSDQAHKANEGATQTKTDDVADQTAVSDNDSSNATQQATDAFSQADKTAADIKTQYPNAVQVADASGTSHSGVNSGVVLTEPTNTLNNYLDTQGNALSPAQQDTLASQIDQLGLGGEGDLSFYSLPNGGALIANADGDIVGEIRLSKSGDLNIKATGIDANGNTVEVNQHINSEGESLSQAQYNAQVQAQANASVNLFNSLMAAQQWDQLDDMGKLTVLVNVYSATDTLGGNLPGDLGGLASVLSLMQGLESGNDMLVLRSSLQLGQLGLDAYSDYMTDLALQMADEMMASSAVDAASSAAMDAAAEAALESAAASNAAGSAVPYVSYVIALQNFEDHPEQSAGTVIGTYIGQALGAEFGPVGSAIGGAIGGFIGGTIGGMFADDDIPMREGLAHAQWDASGHTQVLTSQDAEGGGSTAHAWMSSLVSGLQAGLDQHTDANGQPQYGLVPNLLPSVGFKYDADGFNLGNGAKGFTYLQWTDEEGQNQTRYYDGAGNRGDGSGETLAGDFMAHAQGAIAPAWQVQTTLAHWQQDNTQAQPLEAQAVSLRAQAKQLSQGLAHDDSGQPVVAYDESGQAVGAQEVASLNALNAQASSLEAQAQQIRAANPPHLPVNQTVLPTELADGLHQTLQVLTLELGSALPTESAQISKWIDVDADG